MRRPVLLLTLVAALALAGIATAAPPPVRPSTVYTGKSAQGIPVRLAAAVRSHRWFRYRARMTCTDGSTYLDDYFSDDVAMRHNRFSDAYTSNGGAITTRVTGTLSGTRARGTIRIVERFSEVAVNGVAPLAANGSVVCDSKVVTWSAGG